MCRFRRVTFIISIILYFLFLVNNFIPIISTRIGSMTNFSTSITLFLSLIKSSPLSLYYPLCPLPRPLLLFSSFANSSFDLCPLCARHKVSSLGLVYYFPNAFSLSAIFSTSVSKVIAFIWPLLGLLILPCPNLVICLNRESCLNQESSGLFIVISTIG